MSRDPGDSGRFDDTNDLEDVLRTLRESPSPVATANAVGERLDCTEATARQKLLDLRDRGLVSRRTVSSGAIVWWVSAEDVDPDDPLFAGGALFASDDPVDEADVDDAVYDGAGE